MKRLYQKNELRFALVWIFIYCAVTIPIRGNLGDESPVMLAALALLAAGITGFVVKNGLQEKYGLTHWPKSTGRYLWFIPVWILVTGNLWGGISPAAEGLPQLMAVLSMLLIGYVEEMIFRGFLFSAMLKTDGLKKAVIISAVTFGIGHIVNLLAGQASLETVIQVFFAIAWGFIFTAVFYKGGSLLPCAAAHGLVNAFSRFSSGGTAAEWVYVLAVILTAALYCPYLFRLPDEKKTA
ncbi:MAG: CPBP family intramembrane metalloprotease [Oscillospiraceae bacterium]|nr:CPBP family intramembrane metalloprotease [Oscillospiraceae bacterium]